MTGGFVVGVVVIVVVAAIVVWSLTGGRRRTRARRPPYIAALGALIDGDEDTALAELKNTVREDSSNVDAYLRLGDLFRQRGDGERAFQLHRELASRPGLPRRDLTRVHLALGRDHEALGRLQKAMESAREAARLADDPTAALAQLLRVQEQLDDRAGAFQTKREILKRDGRAKTGARELADYRAAQGAALLEDGSLKEAEGVLKEARKIDPQSPAAQRAWGKLREVLGDYAGAVEAWEGLLAGGAEADDTLFADVERVRFLDGSFSDMEDTYNRFLDKSPGHEAASFGLARFLRRKGQIGSALDICQRGLRAHADSESLRVLHLALLLQSDRAGEAEAVLNDWMSASPGAARPEAAPPAVESEVE